MHADSHPGNFRLTDDGRLGVMDFGAVAVLPDGSAPWIGPVMRACADGDARRWRGVLEGAGLLKPQKDGGSVTRTAG